MPSTCHQVALNLRETGGFDFVMEPRAVQLHVLDPGYGLVSHLSYVSGPRETFQPVSEFKVEEPPEVIQHHYEELRHTEFDV